MFTLFFEMCVFLYSMSQIHVSTFDASTDDSAMVFSSVHNLVLLSHLMQYNLK